MEETMDLSLFTGKFFQLGYVVKDLDKAVEAAKVRTGVPNWQVIHLPAGSLVDGMAFAWKQGVMLELIAVTPATVLPVYANHIPDADDDAKFHHLGYMMESQEEFDGRIAEAEAGGMPLAFNMDFNGVLTCYIDSFRQLGHFAEFVYLTPPMRDFFAGVPQN
jgi:hypothetical protein